MTESVVIDAEDKVTNRRVEVEVPCSETGISALPELHPSRLSAVLGQLSQIKKNLIAVRSWIAEEIKTYTATWRPGPPHSAIGKGTSLHEIDL